MLLHHGVDLILQCSQLLLSGGAAWEPAGRYLVWVLLGDAQRSLHQRRQAAQEVSTAAMLLDAGPQRWDADGIV